jgi:hypothetical protein
MQEFEILLLSFVTYHRNVDNFVVFFSFTKEIQMNPQQLDIYNKNFELLIKRIIHTELSDRQLKEVARKVRQFYFGDRPLCQDTLLEYVDVSKS